ncbi:unnamed protein product [Chilo suppressalis]|uniref:Uncharacterized protein n=1 Tax=Chilo suppressalis TaxID=168631 RepID=A0ABN8AQR3_CHISP|nr:unnamed protein product [Chilo suppressalis]
MGLQSEVCLWTLLGLLRTIFDATLFKVNANLKQVWQMSMPEELSLPVQRALRTMISGVMLVQCFTVYVYLASYIVLLYPVFLEERPTLVLPWLLLAAIRKLLCELTSLALGLGTCVLLGAARPPCIKFVVIKVISIMPSFYTWMLIYSYYHALKVTSVFKNFPAVLPTSEHDYGLELALRRRRAKSLLGEDQLRKNLISDFYNHSPAVTNTDTIHLKSDYSSRMSHGTDTSAEDLKEDINNIESIKLDENLITPVCCEDWLGREVMAPRDTDRILEQFGVMMLRISAFLTNKGTDTNDPETFNSHSIFTELKQSHLDCTAMPPDNADTPPLVGSSSARTASYLRDYPQIFQKKNDIPMNLGRDNSIGRSSPRNKVHDGDNDSIYRKWSNSMASDGSIHVDTKSSEKSNTNEPQLNKDVHDKPSEKSVTFSRNENPRCDYEVKNATNSRVTLGLINNKKESEVKVTTTFSNQTLNESEIRISSITCIKINDEESPVQVKRFSHNI